MFFFARQAHPRERAEPLRLYARQRLQRNAVCRVTSDLAGRVVQHREGVHDGFTKHDGVKRLVGYELTDDMTAAIASEKRIKKWPRDRKKNLIERQNPEWNDLAVMLGFEPLP